MPEVTVDTGRSSTGSPPTSTQRIVDALGRAPTFDELGVFSVMWSEHCCTRARASTCAQLPTTGPRVLQGPGENAGAVDIGDGLAVVFKIESHNHPSFVEPFQGAATGVGGILRDVFTMGARPIANPRTRCASARSTTRARRYLVRGVVARHRRTTATASACRRSAARSTSIPATTTTSSSTRSRSASCAADRIFRARGRRRRQPGDLRRLADRPRRHPRREPARVGRVRRRRREEKRPTVQVGDPVHREAAARGVPRADGAATHIVAIQDMGAAGLTARRVEMAARGGTGIELDLDRVPLREEGMTPYEILLSESQERMLLVVHAGRRGRGRARSSRKWDLEAAVIGQRHRRRPSARALCDGEDGGAHLPSSRSPTTRRSTSGRPSEPATLDEAASASTSRDLPRAERLHADAARAARVARTSARSEWVYRQYDQLVGGNTVVRPGLATPRCVRIKGTRQGARADRRLQQPLLPRSIRTSAR